MPRSIFAGFSKRVPLPAGVLRARDEYHFHLINVLEECPKDESGKHLQSLEPRGAKDSVDSASPSISISIRAKVGMDASKLRFDVASLFDNLPFSFFIFFSL